MGLSSLCEEEDEIEEDTDEEETEDEEDTEEETENTQEDTKEQLSEETKQNITISSLPFRVGLIAVVLCEKYAFFIRHPYKISLGTIFLFPFSPDSLFPSPFLFVAPFFV